MPNLAEILASHGVAEKQDSDAVTSFVKRTCAYLTDDSDVATVYVMRRSAVTDEVAAELNSSDDVIEGRAHVAWFDFDDTTVKSLAGRFERRTSASENHARITYGAYKVGITLTNGTDDTGLVLHRA
jgi:hypothetical protein